MEEFASNQKYLDIDWIDHCWCPWEKGKWTLGCSISTFKQRSTPKRGSLRRFKDIVTSFRMNSSRGWNKHFVYLPSFLPSLLFCFLFASFLTQMTSAGFLLERRSKKTPQTETQPHIIKEYRPVLKDPNREDRYRISSNHFSVSFFPSFSKTKIDRVCNGLTDWKRIRKNRKESWNVSKNL